MEIYPPLEKPVLVSQASDAHAPIIKDSAARASSEANTRPFSAPATRGLASEDAASTARVSATEATSSRAVLIDKRTDNQINPTHRKAYVFATTSAAAPGVVTSAAVTTLWIVGYIYDFESEFDTDYTSSSNSSSTSSLSLSYTSSYHSSSSGTSSGSDSGSSSSSGLDTDSSLSSESDTDDSSSSGSDDASSSDFDSSLLSNREISDNVFDTDTYTLDSEEDVGFSDPGDEVLALLEGANTEQEIGWLGFVTQADVPADANIAVEDNIVGRGHTGSPANELTRQLPDDAQHTHHDVGQSSVSQPDGPAPRSELEREETARFDGVGNSGKGFENDEAGITMVRLVGITAAIGTTKYNDGQQDKHEDKEDKEDDGDDTLLGN